MAQAAVPSDTSAGAHQRLNLMKNFLFFAVALAASIVPASAITVSSPANGAQVTSPFTVTANTGTCASKPAVSMGYSLDSEAAVIEPTSFTASVSAAEGAHVLHVKCWGQQVNSEVLLNIEVVAGTAAPVSNITVTAPAAGTQVSSPFTVTASATVCASKAAVSMGYSIDSGTAVIEPTSFSAAVIAPAGAHVLHIKCWGPQSGDQLLRNITVVPTLAATPAFSPAAGSYTSKQSVTLSTPTPGAIIYYTTNGSAPTTSSPQYTGPITVSSSEVIEAIAGGTGLTTSGMARADYVVTSSSSGPNIPSTATSVTQIQAMSNWQMDHDPATPGTTVGSMSMVSDPSLSGETAEFNTAFTDWGGELYSVSYAKDANASNFVYDAEVWIEEGSEIGNLEMDNNQVIANGDTVIYAFQCSGDSNAWEYSENAGTPQAPVVKWVKSNQPCNPESWTPNAWHHVQISTSRDDAGNVTYHGVWVDGVEAPINETVPSAFSLGWAAADLMANFQIDGSGNGGSSTLYLDKFTMYRW
jgi:chitobiase/beta-hexosaminidase-like protein